jgi:hypothetical protein
MVCAALPDGSLLLGIGNWELATRDNSDAKPIRLAVSKEQVFCMVQKRIPFARCEVTSLTRHQSTRQ